MPSQRLSESDINARYPKRRRIASESRRCGHCNKYRSHSAFTKPGESEILMCSDCRVRRNNQRSAATQTPVSDGDKQPPVIEHPAGKENKAVEKRFCSRCRVKQPVALFTRGSDDYYLTCFVCRDRDRQRREQREREQHEREQREREQRNAIPEKLAAEPEVQEVVPEQSADRDQAETLQAPEPEVKEPEVGEPEVREPEVREPEVREPEIREPEVKDPEVKEQLQPEDPDDPDDPDEPELVALITFIFPVKFWGYGQPPDDTGAYGDGSVNISRFFLHNRGASPKEPRLYIDMPPYHVVN
ncbi:hypothetical protein V8E54_001110 [Elaphomyces granulatus]